MHEHDPRWCTRVIRRNEPDRAPGHRPNMARTIIEHHDVRRMIVELEGGEMQICCEEHWLRTSDGWRAVWKLPAE